MSASLLSKNNPILGRLLAVLTECASKGVARPTTAMLAEEFVASSSSVRIAQRMLAESGDIVVDTTPGTSRVYVRSVDAWTAESKRRQKATAESKPEAVVKKRRCVLADCRSEFIVRYNGEWYCPQCRKDRRIP